MRESEIKNIIEALLFSSPEPLTQKKIDIVFYPESPKLEQYVSMLNQSYLDGNHSFEIREVSHGVQLVSLRKYEPFIRRMLHKSGKLSLSAAALDCLAIISYKQPIGRHELEAIRGVDSSGVIKTLLSRSLIRIKGRDLGPGRPLLYQTTDSFLEYFGLKSMSDLPKLKEITELIESDPSLGEQIAVFEKEQYEDTLNNEK
jgi:segregation and condensation protein B|tara:strand:+ start:165 stop:767 length:603 start_codon:yes stop_codon:yes gene_type:complete